jgi:hypothetical protein
LEALDNYVRNKNVKELFRGNAWSKNCREWVYYDCVLNVKKLKEKFSFNNCVIIREYNDIKVANELGFFCNRSKMALWDLILIMKERKIK